MTAPPATRLADDHIADGRWSFDSAVTDRFDDMLERSIPQYDTMRDLVAEIAGRFLRPRSTVLDIGTSRGEALAQLNPSAHPDTHFVGVECSPPMLAAARDRFAGYGNVTVLDHDLRSGLPDTGGLHTTADGALSVCLSVLTAMFVPIEHRPRLIAEIHDRLAPGGVLLLVEKTLGDTSRIDDLLASLYLDRKRRVGYTEEQIARKRLALEGVLVPVTAGWNETMLRRAGFDHVDLFWRWGPFAGWVAVKGDRR